MKVAGEGKTEEIAETSDVTRLACARGKRAEIKGKNSNQTN